MKLKGKRETKAEKLKLEKGGYKNFNSAKGITLIAFVITIIVLLILAGVSVATLTGDNGVLQKAVDAKDESENSSLGEEVKIALLTARTNGLGNLSKENIEEELNKITGATVEQTISDAWLVTKGNSSVTVYENGEIIEGKVLSWDGVSEEVPEIKDFEWYIYTPAQLKFLANFVNNGNEITEEQKPEYEEKYGTTYPTMTEETKVYLMNNLDMGARATDGNWETEANQTNKWTPIGTSTTVYMQGTFLGQNHTIKGIYVNENADNVGLFACTNTVKALTIKDSYVKGKNNVGGIIGNFAKGTIENCKNINTTVIGNAECGGIIGYGTTNNLNGYLVKGCSNTGNVIAEVEDAGGIIGISRAEIVDCNNIGNIESKGNFAGGITSYTVNNMSRCSNEGSINGNGSYVGGLIGYSNGEIKDCHNTGNISGNRLTGGVVGSQNGTGLKIIKCYNTGNVIANEKSTRSYVGGIAGHALNSSIEECYNTGEVTGYKAYVGGIVSGCYGEVKNCCNTANVTGGSNTGGIAGNGGNIDGCGNSGKISCNNGAVGGIVGAASYEIKNCINEGEVTSTGGGELGGIVGVCGANYNITNCYNKGKVVEIANSQTGVGGIVGYVNDGLSGNISNNYNIGEIEIKGTNVKEVGGAIGRVLTSESTRSYNYYLEGKSNVTLNSEGESKAADEMKKQEFVDLLNTGLEKNAWIIDSSKNDGYPILIEE